MATISKIIDRGPAVVLMNAAHITAEDDNHIEFEVLEADANSLLRFVGIKQLLAYNGVSFWGELTSLEPCSSTTEALGLLRDKPTLRGVIRKFSGEPVAMQ